MTEVAHANRSRGEGVGKRGPISAIFLAMLTALNGCIFQQEPKVVQGEPYPDPGGKTHVDRRDVGGAKTETALSANALDVTMTQPSECRDETPMVRDVTTERQANTMWQVVNGGGAILFGGLGAYALAGDCTVTPDPTASNQNPASRPCTGKEEGQATALGVGLVATGALFGAAFIYNVIKARDSKETAPIRVARDWKTCGTRPVAGEPLHLDLADGQQVVQTTNAQGQAHFDLAAVRWTDEALKSPQARVGSGSQQLASVDLTALPQYVQWKSANDKAETQRRLAEEKTQHIQAEQARALSARLEQWARSAVKVGWSSKSHHSETCFNRVDTMVPCDSAAAVRKSTSDIDETIATATNATGAPFLCKTTDSQTEFMKSNGLGMLAAPDKGMVALAPRSSHAFSSDMVGGMAALGGMMGVQGVAQVTLMCGTRIVDLTKAKALPADLAGASPGQFVVIAVVHDASTNATSYGVHVMNP